jgi:hypothetical protein
VGSSSVPLPSLKDYSATKPASAPPKSNLKPIPFNQYGSNLTDSELFPPAKSCLSPVPQASEKAQTSSESKSEEPISPNILKRQGLSAEDKLEVGWESPEDWENDQETLAEKIAKLKRKQDGKVDNPPSRIKKKPGVKPKRAVVTSSPVTATRRSTRARARIQSTCCFRPPSVRLKKIKVRLQLQRLSTLSWFFPRSQIHIFGGLRGMRVWGWMLLVVRFPLFYL